MRAARPLERCPRARALEKDGYLLRKFRANGRIVAPADDENRKAIERGRKLRLVGPHRPQQNGGAQNLRALEDKRHNNVRTIGKSDGDRMRQVVMTASPIDKRRKFVGSQRQILQVEIALSDAAEKPRLSILENIAAQRQPRRAGRHLRGILDQIVFTAAGTMKQKKRRALRVGPFNEAVDIGLHGERY
ncbi:MAG TPA: hypothetical protein VHD14_07575 [Pseudolabrys sp.]|nr:hypothetical protein [Pseudolabrys sp.]